MIGLIGQMITKEIFIKKYSKALQANNAAVFTGAGTSLDAGFVSWKELIEPLASELNLDIDQEPDLVKVAQYYVNSKSGNRSHLNNVILNSFLSTNTPTKVLSTLARLPIYNYWTTNYDKLLETALENNNRLPDVKITNANLAQNINNRDAIVYKMHGDLTSPENAVITKDDYDEYYLSHDLFTTALKGDLVSKTFLFVGFSFEDPNLDYVLSRVRILLNGQVREHYGLFKKVQKSDYTDDHSFQIALIRQKLKITDLERFGINVVLLDDYAEIPEILEQIEKQMSYNSIFISGSIDTPEGKWTSESINTFCFNLSKKIVEKNWKILSGVGLGIGSTIISGALEATYDSKYKKINDSLSMYPFPQIQSGKKLLKKQWESYRQNIISNAGICIFIFGNKLEKEQEKEQVINADGMLDEYSIANHTNKLIIPVGGTGGASKQIYDEMLKEKEKYPYLNGYWSDLNVDDPNILQTTILDIISKANSI